MTKKHSMEDGEGRGGGEWRGRKNESHIREAPEKRKA